MRERVLAITVCYNPDRDLLEQSSTALLEQGCDVLLIDNGSDNIDQIKELILALKSSASSQLHKQSKPSANLKEFEQNYGLGRAHNVGIQYAQQHAYDFILIMDQDSVPLASMLNNLLLAYQAKTANKERVSATGVTYLNSQNGHESFFIRFGKLKFSRFYSASKDNDGCIEADFLISSGSLISLETIEDVGLMDESLFIDHVDTEWFLRAKNKGFKAFGVTNATMQHGLGDQTHQLSFGGRKRNVPQHKPFRYYYIFRNSILLYKRPYASHLWKWNDLQRLLLIFVMFGFLKSPRLANLGMMFNGIWDGLKGKSGPIDHA